jgi:hypothetical protein
MDQLFICAPFGYRKISKDRGRRRYKTPSRRIDPVQSEELLHCRRYIQASIPVSIRAWSLASKHVLPVVRLERADVLPLRICDTVAFSDSDPAVFANALTIANKRLLEPGNDRDSLGLCVMVVDIVVRKRDVERVSMRSVSDPVCIKRAPHISGFTRPKDRASYSGLPVAWIEQREENLPWGWGTLQQFVSAKSRRHVAVRSG